MAIYLMRLCGTIFQVCHGIRKDLPDPSLFDPDTGLPLVRDHVDYGELLSEIRLGRVKEIHWFTVQDSQELQGPCLVEYKDGKVKQSHIVNTDLRIPQAMQVRCVMIEVHEKLYEG